MKEEYRDYETVYCYCPACSNYSYRVIGYRHGDGQTDTAGNPVWLLTSKEDVPIGETIIRAFCGCND